MSDNRQKLLNKIRALLAKTVENGCTEAEAMSAISMAQAMMDAYEVTEDDVKLDDEKADIKQSDMRDPHHIRRRMATRVSEFVGCQVWTSNNKKTINFCGLQSDTDFAIWLIETLTAFVQKELKTHIWGNNLTSLPPDQKRLHINGFVLGCTGRINARIYDLIEASKAKSTVNKNALVVAKNELIDKRMSDEGLRLRTPRERSSYVNVDSTAAGKAAGDKASFGRPVSGQHATLRIR